MKVTTNTEQTRAVDRYSGMNSKKELLADFSKKITSIDTDTQRSMKFGNSWAKRNTSTTYEINDFLTRQEEFILRSENYLRETLSVYFALHAFDGVLSAEHYNEIVEQVKSTYKNSINELNVQGYVLTLYNNNTFVGTKLFDDVVRMKLWFKKHLGCDYNLFLNPITVPEQFAGSILSTQDWCINPETFFDKLKSQS